MKKINCPVCNSSEIKLFLKMKDFAYSKCLKCSLVYQNPQPSMEIITAIYDRSYFDYEIQNQINFAELAKLGLKDINFDKITKDFETKKILDIGCATGLLLKYFKDNGWDTTGIEICKESAEYGIKNYDLNIIQKPIEEAKLSDNSFDIVHLAHLIEHTPDPDIVIKETYRVLKPGGYLILTTPNISGLAFKIFRKKWRSAIFQHLFLFSKKTMKKLLVKNNYKIEKIISWGSFLPIDINPPKFLKKIADRACKKLNIGDVMLFLAKK